MKALSIYGFFMIVLCFISHPVFADHQTFSIETDLAGASAPHRRIGFDLEIWPLPWFAVGAGREIDAGISTRHHVQSSSTNQSLTLRLQFSGFFVKLSSLERQHTIRKKDSSTPEGTAKEPDRTASLTGVRTSLGYWYELGVLAFSIGYFQESLSTHKFTFNDNSTKKVGGDFGWPFLTVALAF